MVKSNQPLCELCGEPMPEGEEMFNYHGYSGNCPKPPLQPKDSEPNPITSCHNVEAVVVGSETMHYECPVCNQSVNFDGSDPKSIEPCSCATCSGYCACGIKGHHNFMKAEPYEQPQDSKPNFKKRLREILVSYWTYNVGQTKDVKEMWGSMEKQILDEHNKALTELDKLVVAMKIDTQEEQKLERKIFGSGSGSLGFENGHNKAIDDISKLIRGMM